MEKNLALGKFHKVTAEYDSKMLELKKKGELKRQRNFGVAFLTFKNSESARALIRRFSEVKSQIKSSAP